MPRCQYKYPWGKQCDSNKAYYHQVKKKYLCLAHAEIEEQKKPLTKAQRVKQLKKLSPLDQIMQDVVALARFYRNPGDDRLGEFLKKLFRTVSYGGLLFREQADETDGPHGWQWWHYTNLPVASVFGHGGRLMIQDETPDHIFTAWLFGDVDGLNRLVTDRFSTHEMRKDESKIGIKLIPKALKEIKSKVTHICCGLNAACWGFGKINPHSRQRVDLAGGHGHFCIVRDSQRWFIKFGKKGQPIMGILIGLEGSKPGKPDQYGGAHDASGASGEFSPVGTRKWRYLAMGPGCRYTEVQQRITKTPYFNLANPASKPGKKKTLNPKVADTLFIRIPPEWMPNHFPAELKEGKNKDYPRFLRRTTQKPEWWNRGCDTKWKDMIRDNYNNIIGGSWRLDQNGLGWMPKSGQCPHGIDFDSDCKECDRKVPDT